MVNYEAFKNIRTYSIFYKTLAEDVQKVMKYANELS